MLYNKIVENLFFPIADGYLGTTFIKELKYWRNKVDKMSAHDLQQMQQDRLSFLLAHTVKNIPFYQKRNIHLTGNAYDDVKLFPVMHKKVVRDNINSLFIGDKSKMIVEKSSGSSGIQGEVYMTLKENLNYQAVQTYLWEWGGYNLGDPIMQTGITPERKGIKKLKDIVLNTHYVNAFSLSTEQVLKELKEAKKKRSKYFAGYSSSLNVFAEASIENNLDIRFDGVISWGDKLFDHYKVNISKAFGNPTFAEVYGTTEGFMIAGLCEAGNHHILTPHVYLELLDKDGNDVAPGELGYVVVTRLDCFSMPLVRYYLGDLAIKEDDNKKCSCGRNFPLLKKIVGRDTDIVHTPKGKALIVHFFTGVFEHIPEIEQFRIIQSEPGNILIEYIPAPTLNENTLTNITEKIFSRAEEEFPIHYKEVKSIPATSSGKPQLVLNTITKKLTDNL